MPMRVIGEEIRHCFKRAVQVEPTPIKYLIQRHRASRRAVDGDMRVDLPDTGRHGLKMRRIDQIRLY